MNQQHVSIKPVPSLLLNSDLSNKDIQIFISNKKSIWYNITMPDNMTSWANLNYFKYTCTLKLKLYNYHRVFASIYFWKIRKIEFALKCLHYSLVLKQSPLFGKLKKAKELLFTVFWEKIIQQKMNSNFFIRLFFVMNIKLF